MPKFIDIHTHAFPDGIAARAVAKLEAECPINTVAPATVESLLSCMDEGGVDASVICAISTKPHQNEGILAWCDAIRSERIIPFPSVHPDTPDAGRWIERIARDGFRGIKLHPMYQDFVIDEPRLDPIYAAAEACGVIVEFHAGRDFAFPGLEDRAHPRRYVDVLRRFGKLKAIVSHMGGWRMWDESEQHLVGKVNAYLETSYSLADLGPERAVKMIRRHGVERVLFGTDWPWARQSEDVRLLKSLPLEPGEIDRIASSNAVELLGL